jgi:hypothetical protein
MHWVVAFASWHGSGINESTRRNTSDGEVGKMKKEILKGFSLLALIIVFALMTAVASNAPLTTVEANSTSQSVVNDVTASNAKGAQN